MKILAIETSCDETSVAVVENGHHVHSLVVNSQIDIHKAYGGVVPEIAARSHIEVILPVKKARREEGLGVVGAREREDDPVGELFGAHEREKRSALGDGSGRGVPPPSS